MSLIFTPGQCSRRAEFYLQLNQLTSAGLGLVAALEQLRRNPPARSYRQPIEQLLEQLAAGYTLAESLQRVGGWLPAFDIALLQAGEQSGRLDSCFRLLADYYNDRARIARRMLSDLAYPVFLFHFAILIFAFVRWFNSGTLLGFFLQTLGVLLPIYALVILAIYAAQSRHGERWRGWVESALRPVPVLGTARHYLALSRLAAALEALLSAGVTVIEAWELAATACGSPALRRTVVAWRPQVHAGRTPSEVVSASSRFPSLFANQYATGEVSGKLDDTLQRLHTYYQEEGSRKLHALAQWTPRAVYLFVALMIGYYVINSWSAHFKQIQDVTDGFAPVKH